MRRWELWGSAFFPEDNDQGRQMAIEDGQTLTWYCWFVRTSDVIDWNTDPRSPKIPHGWRDH